jgi:hypothetical protein
MNMRSLSFVSCSYRSTGGVNPTGVLHDLLDAWLRGVVVVGWWCFFFFGATHDKFDMCTVCFGLFLETEFSMTFSKVSVSFSHPP